MERLLHYVWKHKMLPLKPLTTTDGQPVEVIDVGMHNHNQGPDFFNAKVRLGDTLWAGNVEVHLRSSDWYRHRHDTDAAYNGVVLHIVGEADEEVRTQDGKLLPQVQLDVPEHVRRNYEHLCKTEDYPRCHSIVGALPLLKVHQWMDALLWHRMEERAAQHVMRVDAAGGDWERGTFITLSRNFGFGLNGDAFERWATLIPLTAAGKHRDNLQQVEALFLGMAGLIEASKAVKSEEEVQSLHREFAFLSHKFGLPHPMQYADWRFLRTRPGNFPFLRIMQLAELFHSGKARMSSLMEAQDVKTLQTCLAAKGTTAGTRNLLIINTVVPLLVAYGRHVKDETLRQRAVQLLEQLPAENNYILRQWRSCGVEVNTAADSQALIQLKRVYCDRMDCLRCRFGYEFLKQN